MFFDRREDVYTRIKKYFSWLIDATRNFFFFFLVNHIYREAMFLVIFLDPARQQSPRTMNTTDRTECLPM